MARWQLLTFITRRFAAMVGLLLLVSFLVFSLLYLAPGDAVQVLLGTRGRDPQLVHELRTQFHLDDPFLQQYWIWLKQVVSLNFGTSIQTGRSVLSGVGPQAGVTIFLALYAFVVAIVVGVPLGILAALRRRRTLDRTIVAGSILGVSAPAFITGIGLLYVFGVTLGWFPVYGAGSGFFDRAWHLTLPAIALASASMALVVKITRAAMIEVLDEDYVTFARARGVPRGQVIVRYALRNALIPVVTSAGLLFTGLVTATVIVEVAFALPGIGAQLVDAVGTKDMPVVQGITLLIAAVIIGVNLIVDIVYALVDPRITFGTRLP
jgi:peptide/nickel transport system permease protein